MDPEFMRAAHHIVHGEAQANPKPMTESNPRPNPIYKCNLSTGIGRG
jgi:hypothetical protein